MKFKYEQERGYDILNNTRNDLDKTYNTEAKRSYYNSIKKPRTWSQIVEGNEN